MKASTKECKQRSIAALSTHQKSYIAIAYALKKPLQPSEVNVMNLFNKNLGEPIDSYTFRKHGITSIPQCIYRLKRKGAAIKTDYSDVIDNIGVKHKRAAKYLFIGWH